MERATSDDHITEDIEKQPDDEVYSSASPSTTPFQPDKSINDRDRYDTPSKDEVNAEGSSALVFVIVKYALFVLDIRDEAMHDLALLLTDIDANFARVNIYERARQPLSLIQSVVAFNMGYVFYGVLTWFLITRFKVSLKESTILGSQQWKWALFFTTTFWGYSVSFAAIFLPSKLIESIHGKIVRKENNIAYHIRGLIQPVSATLHFGLVFVAWMIYFRTDRALKSSTVSSSLNEKVLMFGTWTLLSLIVGSILWIVKTFLLLKWKANAIYSRFKGKIIVSGFQLYFLYRITGGGRRRTLRTWSDAVDKLANPSSTVTHSHHHTNQADDDNELRYTLLDMRDYLMKQSVINMYELQTAAEWIRGITRETTDEKDDGIPVVEKEYGQKLNQGNKNETDIMNKLHLKDTFGLDDNDAQLLYALLRNWNKEESITYSTLIKWMIESHKKCVMLGSTLRDSDDAANMLNVVMTIILVVMVIFLWLLLTGIATTQVIVLVISPFLALTFVFGDTFKSSFQGFIFSFISHPFDVGDRCIIDGFELEVKRVGILTTTFKKIGSEERVLSPNSDLAIKSIINLDGEPEPSDVIELILDTSTNRSQLKELQAQIDKFFNPDGLKNELFKPSHSVLVSEIGNKNIKLGIYFTHVIAIDDVTHTQCYQKKSE